MNYQDLTEDQYSNLSLSEMVEFHHTDAGEMDEEVRTLWATNEKILRDVLWGDGTGTKFSRQEMFAARRLDQKLQKLYWKL